MGSRLLAAVLLTAVVAASPWVFGLSFNTVHGWQDHLLFWGDLYNTDQNPGTPFEAPPPTRSWEQFLAGSAWLPVGLGAGSLLVNYIPNEVAPDPLVVRMPEGRQVQYIMVNEGGG